MAGATCTGWPVQGGPESDRTGLGNTNFPEASSTTYWTTKLSGVPGTTVTVAGRFPYGRFTALEVYTGDELVDHISDVDIQPDPGQNNPYVSGTDNGTYTVTVMFGPQPATKAPNTIYTGFLTSVVLMYRIYHATDANDPAGGARDPVLPALFVDGAWLQTCPVRPFLKISDSTPWGRLDDGGFIGSPPGPRTRIASFDPPVWSITAPYSAHYYPNGANFYMSATLSREFISPATGRTLYLVRFRAPTFPDTRAGEPVYADRQVHFWSMCTDDPYTTNVNRCLPDDAVVLDADGFATFVFSDRSTKPSDALLQQHKANWIALGALRRSTDVVYDRAQQPWGVNTPVHYYNALLYRQTLARGSFLQSFANVYKAPLDQQQAAMGDYWPVGGYCTAESFAAQGFACTGH